MILRVRDSVLQSGSFEFSTRNKGAKGSSISLVLNGVEYVVAPDVPAIQERLRKLVGDARLMTPEQIHEKYEPEMFGSANDEVGRIWNAVCKGQDVETDHEYVVLFIHHGRN